MIYAFIPARSGSTRLKDKNFLMLKDKRLLNGVLRLLIPPKTLIKLYFHLIPKNI